MESFSDVFHTHFKPLVFFAQRVTGDDMEGQDIVIDVFMKIHQKGIPVTKGFLYIAVMNRCKDYLRKVKSRRKLVPDVIEDKEFQKDIQDVVLLEEIWEEIGKLHPAQRETLTLKFAAGMTNAEIAKLKNVKEEAVRFNCFNAFRNLRSKFLNSRYFEEATRIMSM